MRSVRGLETGPLCSTALFPVLQYSLEINPFAQYTLTMWSSSRVMCACIFFFCITESLWGVSFFMDLLWRFTNLGTPSVLLLVEGTHKSMLRKVSFTVYSNLACARFCFRHTSVFGVSGIAVHKFNTSS